MSQGTAPTASAGIEPPKRFPAEPLPVAGGMRLIGRLLGVAPAPSADEFRRLGELLYAGDPEMDELVEWMLEAGVAATKPLFQRALTEGIAAVPDAPEPLRAFFATYETLPDWVEPEKLALAAQVMRCGGADGLYIARDVALIGGYQYSGFNQTLLRTGALEKGSNARFAETSQWALDVIHPDELRPLGRGYRSTLHVRFIHSMVRRHVEAMPDWDDHEWGLPINQTDMAATLVGALVAPSVGGIGMGLINRPREYEAVAHLTRYVGWLMGVRDDLLPHSFRDALRILIHTSSALAIPDETSKLLARPMADDPRQWHYDRAPQLHRRIARSQHLSITAGFLGPRAMRTLGLNPFVLPWYPALRLPINLMRSIAKLRPGGLTLAAERGAAESEVFMRTMAGDPVAIGDSAHVAHHAA
ncbi:oxygenase MpaB family protein [Gordonia sp. VNK21]|uniref:oxygenase MpaB family protein n=1 Tax=Gordonia sp. VNK21 TaxID=3382483 RepID=UPI0038D40B4E